MACVLDWEGSVKVDEGNLQRLQVEDDVVRFKVPMHVSQAVQLFQTSYYLKQNIVQLTVVTVL